MKIVIYPGSFDPITYGHIDIIKRAAEMYEQVYVAVMINSEKQYSFSLEERKQIATVAVQNISNVEVISSDGMLWELVRDLGAGAIVKGLRAMSDFEYEFQMALTNKKLNPNTETVFLTTRAENMYLSSSMVKQIGSMGGDISDFVPKKLAEKIVERLKNQ